MSQQMREMRQMTPQNSYGYPGCLAEALDGFEYQLVMEMVIMNMEMVMVNMSHILDLVLD